MRSPLFYRTPFITVLALILAIYSAPREMNTVHAEDAKAEVELPKPDADGWISLFNGTDLTGWDGDPKVWSVKDGCISGKAEKVDGNTFLIFKHTFSNFILEAECMLIKGSGFTNSGIQYRSKVVNPAKWVVHGYQADIGEGYWGDNYDEGGRAYCGRPAPRPLKQSSCMTNGIRIS